MVVETDEPTTAKPLEEFSLKQLAGNYEKRAGVGLEITIKDSSLNVLQSWNKSTYKSQMQN